MNENNNNNNPAPNPAGDLDKSDAEKNKQMAILAYFIFFLPMVTDAKDSKFAMFHANQSLLLVLLSLVGPVALRFVPVMGGVLSSLCGLVVFVFWIMGLVSASKLEMKELPLIGGIHLLDK